MFRIYYLSNDEGWVLYSRHDTKDLAYDMWNKACDKYPNAKVRMTEETVLKED